MAINSGNISWKDSTGSCSTGIIGMLYINRRGFNVLAVFVFYAHQNMLSKISSNIIIMLLS